MFTIEYIVFFQLFSWAVTVIEEPTIFSRNASQKTQINYLSSRVLWHILIATKICNSLEYLFLFFFYFYFFLFFWVFLFFFIFFFIFIFFIFLSIFIFLFYFFYYYYFYFLFFIYYFYYIWSILLPIKCCVFFNSLFYLSN